MMGIFDDTEIQYETQDIKEAIKQIYYNTGELCAEWDSKVVELAKELYAKRIAEISKDIDDIVNQHEVKPSKIDVVTNSETHSTDVEIPRPPKKKEVPTNTGVINIDKNQLKAKSVGIEKNLKVIIKVLVPAALAVALLSGFITFILSIDTKIKEYIGSKDNIVDISDYEDFEWHGRHYRTWYNFGPIGHEVAEKAYEDLDESDLNYEDLLLIGFGEAINDVITEENHYGDPAHYYLSEGMYPSLDRIEHEDGTVEFIQSYTGWATGIYNGIVKESEKYGVELPSLEEFIKEYQLDQGKAKFNKINGTYEITPFEKLDPEEQAYYNKTEGWLANLMEAGKYMSYMNGLHRGGSR